jgi:hypothetical protein
MLAFLPSALAQQTAAARAAQELDSLRAARTYDVEPALEAVDRALHDAIAEQEHLALLERDLQYRIVREESLIHRDRRIIAERKPGAALRRLAAEREEAGAERRRRYGALPFARPRAYRRGRFAGTRAGRLHRAVLGAFSAIDEEVRLQEERRDEVIRGVLDLAEEMERQAQQQREPREEK